MTKKDKRRKRQADRFAEALRNWTYCPKCGGSIFFGKEKKTKCVRCGEDVQKPGKPSR